MVTAGLMTAQSWDYSPVLWWSRRRESMEWFRFTRLNAGCANRPKWSCVALLNTWPGNRDLHFTQRLTTLTEWEKKKNILNKSQRVPSLRSSVYSQICHTLIQRVSFYLTFIVEGVWFLYLAQLLISDYIKSCIIWWFRGFTCNCAEKTWEETWTLLAGCLENKRAKL